MKKLVLLISLFFLTCKNTTNNPIDPYSSKILSSPSLVRIEARNSTSLQISWEKIKEAQKYKIYRTQFLNQGFSLIAETTQTSYLDSSLDFLTTYYYRITSYQNNEESEPLGYFSGKTLEPFRFILSFGFYGTGDGDFRSPNGIAISKDNKVCVTDIVNKKILCFQNSGTFLQSFTASFGTNSPKGIAFDSQNFMYVVDTANRLIKKLDWQGNIVLSWGGSGTTDGKFSNPEGITIDEEDFIYITDVNNARVQKFDKNGNFITKWGSFGSNNGQFMVNAGISYCAGKIFVSDTETDWIQVFDKNGNWLASFNLSGIVSFPRNITCFSAQGDILISDYQLHRIFWMNPSGQIVYQWGVFGNSADDHFYQPLGIVSDSSGFVYMVDSGNYRIKKWKRD